MPREERRSRRALGALLLLGALAAGGCGGAAASRDARTPLAGSLVLPPTAFDADSGFADALASRRDAALGNRPTWSAPTARRGVVLTYDVTRTTNGRIYEASRTRTRTLTVR